MQIGCKSIGRTCAENKVWNQCLNLDGAEILELGCGAAELTRQIAERGTDRRITAMEVDKIQHAKNLQVTDLSNIRFVTGGAEDIPCDDKSFDIVLMFKSLHHVSPASMDTALNEIRRVLKPNGITYISEPVFAGDFNDILSLFHNEDQVRKAAFTAVKRAVDDGAHILQPMRVDVLEKSL